MEATFINKMIKVIKEEGMKTFAFSFLYGDKKVVCETQTIKECLQVIYFKLPIFLSAFGIILEKSIMEMSPDSCILDDNIIIEEKEYKENSDTNRKNTGSKSNLVIKFKEKYMLLVGHLQSGKTAVMIGMSARLLMFGISPIILLRNITNDLIQTRDRIEAFKQKFLKNAKDNGVTDFPFEIKVFDEFSDPKKIKNMLTANPPVICLILANPASLGKITRKIETLSNSSMNYALFIDEIDSVDSTSAAVISPLINILKQNAKQVVGVSATILGAYAEWNVPPHCIRELRVPDKYLGIRNLHSKMYDTGQKHIKSTDSIEEIFKIVPSLKKYLYKISRGKNNLAETLISNNQAMIDLLSITQYIDPYKKIMDYMIITYPHVAIVLMVDEGIKVYHPSLGNESIKIKNRYPSTVENYVHTFSGKVDVGAVLAILEKKTVKLIKNVLILAGNKASRAVSFSSSGLEYNSEESKLNRWHVSRMFIKFSDNITQDEALQRVGRLCGIFNTGTSQYVYGSETDIETTRKAYGTHEDLLDVTSRKYGTMVDVQRPINAESNADLINVRTWRKSEIDTNIGGKDLLNSAEISGWKLKVPSFTKTGKKKETKKLITNRDCVNPKIVIDDERKEINMFDFLYRTICPIKVIPITPGKYKKNTINDEMMKLSTSKRIIYILTSTGQKLSSADIFKIGTPWDLISKTPLNSVCARAASLYKNGTIKKDGELYYI